MNDPTPRRDGDWLDDDDNLLDALRAASESADPVPSRLADAARAAFTWRTIDTELAELQFDSAVDATSVRGLAWPRQLSFDSTDVSVEIEIDHDRLVGQVIPPAEVDVTLTDSAGQTRSIRSDAVGHFTFTEVESGTVRIRAELPGGSVTTQWFTL
ncbi:MAG: carboxypeptidase regulatory-like domain-containing protein [Acidimicrobiia bacterium]|nr:carboxypeptidase regulatory-like domain-containing protein [Acidimicrobiia bacterium]